MMRGPDVKLTVFEFIVVLLISFVITYFVARNHWDSHDKKKENNYAQEVGDGP